MSLSLMMRHHALLAAAADNKIIGYVRIGEHDYPYVKIGNLYWLAENYKEYNNSITKKSPNGEQSNVSEYGYLYRQIDVADGQGNTKRSISDYSNGWRIPTKSDLENLATFINGKNIISKKFGGTDEYGFNLKPAGMYEGSYSEFGTFAHIMSSSTHSNSGYYQIYIKFSNGSIGNWGLNKNNSFTSIRLCKDA